jgi:hypothetical protein
MSAQWHNIAQKPVGRHGFTPTATRRRDAGAGLLAQPIQQYGCPLPQSGIPKPDT